MFLIIIKTIILMICLLVLVLVQVNGFPSGAPAEACESLSPERGHLTPPQSKRNAPFTIVQHGLYYRPGDKISVEIIPRDPHANFKGFVIQAMDPRTHEYIGEFIGGHGMQLMSECSAVTHSNAKPKRAANLVWTAPHNRHGEVIFRATIVVRKDIYFVNLRAHIPPQYHAAAKK